MEKEAEIVLAQWQTCVEMANSISQRRDAMNNVFITVNLALITAVSLTFEIKSIFILAAGIILCILWRLFIRYYKILNEVKFSVIQEIETHLPMKPFKEEWIELKSRKKYKDATKLEFILPVAFSIVYVCIIIFIVLMKTIK